MLGDAMWSPFILTINITTMENKYWHNIPDNDDDNEEEELDALALAKAKKEQDILDEMEEDNNDNT